MEVIVLTVDQFRNFNELRRGTLRSSRPWDAEMQTCVIKCLLRSEVIAEQKLCRFNDYKTWLKSFTAGSDGARTI